MRRLLVLALCAVAAGALVLCVQGERRTTGQAAVRGPRVFKTRPAAVERVTIALGDRRLEAARRDGGWRLGATAAGPQTADALDDLVRELCTLRAVDRFRPRDDADFGLAAPRAMVTLAHGSRRTRLALGDLNAGRSALYARRDGSPRVLVLGIGMLSALDRVLYFSAVEAGGAPVADAPPPPAA